MKPPALVSRMFQLYEEHTTRIVVLMIVGTSVLRLAYGLFIVDPVSGPDADTYLAAAQAFHRHGFLTDQATGIPYWPAGYPAAIGALFVAFGEHLALVSLLQVPVVGVATYLTFRLVHREFGRAPAFVTAALLCGNLALGASSTLLMYEPLLLSGLVAGYELFSRGSRAPQARHQGDLLIILGALIIGLAAAIQPKVLIAGVIGVLWAISRVERRIAVGVVCLLALATGPVILSARTLAAEGTFAMSSNLGTTMNLGVPREATEGCPEGANEFEQDQNTTKCILAWHLEHPVEALELMPDKALRFWSPMVGPLAARGTWFHAFHYARVLPGSIAGAEWFPEFEVALFNVWTAITVVLWLVGTVLAVADRRTRGAAVAFLLVVLSFLGTSLLSIGDPRFRLPVAPFYTTFMAYSLVVAVRALRRRSTDVPEERSESGPV